MSDRILFSAIGGHDPVANFRDGAMVHICRVYQPKKVYLYLSKEKTELSELDYRYEEALRLLQKDLDFHIEEIHLIKRPDLVDVHIFDQFYGEFDRILSDIHTQNPESEILINISSGTPGMKNALNLISAVSPYAMKTIQVATPAKKENQKDENAAELNLEEYWSCNEDCCEDFENRCTEIVSLQLLAKIKKESILKMIAAYDYARALSVAEEIVNFMPEDSVKLLQGAKYRSLLDQSNFSKTLQGTDFDLIPIKSSENRSLFEYILLLKIKQKRGDYADFVRAITPVVADLFEKCLTAQCGINIKDYCEQRSGVYFLSNRKFEATQKGIEYRNVILEYKNVSELKEMAFSYTHIAPLMQHYCQDAELILALSELSIVESAVRNMAAHEIVSVTDDWIAKRFDEYMKNMSFSRKESIVSVYNNWKVGKIRMNSKRILELIQKIAVKSGMNVKKEYWDSYDQMNRLIAEILQ